MCFIPEGETEKKKRYCLIYIIKMKESKKNEVVPCLDENQILPQEKVRLLYPVSIPSQALDTESLCLGRNAHGLNCMNGFLSPAVFAHNHSDSKSVGFLRHASVLSPQWDVLQTYSILTVWNNLPAPIMEVSEM